MRRLTASLLAAGIILAADSFVASPARSDDAPKSQPAKEKSAEPIDFARARSLLQKQRRGEQLAREEEEYLRRAQAARREAAGQNPAAKGTRPAALTPRPTTGLKPLTEMSATDRYQGQDGGLYGEGKNVPPANHLRAAEGELAQIRPLDAQGKASDSGRVVFISISMSNATQEFSRFKRRADADPAKSSQLTIVDCAQGGQAMAEWADPAANAWREALRRIEAAGVTPQQVQVAWIKLANKGPSGDLAEHGKQLHRDTLSVIQLAKTRFPNLRIAYLSSRIYGGYATNRLNPEPYAYESAFAARWLIQDQIKGEASLAFDGPKGAAKAPLLLWGPYLWADGTTPRASDKLAYAREDLAGDGTHPSESGREKVARVMLQFFKNDPLAKSWFVRD